MLVGQQMVHSTKSESMAGSRRMETRMMKRMIAVGLLISSTTLAQVDSPAKQFMQAMEQSMTTMDHNMAAAPMNGGVDHDFAAMMIPHHDGAIDMAKAELRFGKDPVMRRMAQEILVEQQSEIDAMNLWITKQH
jgi:uncharacterized protein (DUF305 family)